MTDGLTLARAPRRAYWELTRACDLACRHCRAEAVPDRDPRELTTEEGRRLLEQLTEFGAPPPHVVLTGGDPLKRPDLWELGERGVSLGFPLSLAPSGTPALSREAIERAKSLGVEAISLSLDGPDAERHDGFRRVPGCFARTVEAASAVLEEGIPLQINTLVTAETQNDLPALFSLVQELGVSRWSLFFLISVGRGRGLQNVTPDRCERLLHWLYDRSREVPFVITTTEAPHYRRVAWERMSGEGRSAGEIRRSPLGRSFGMRDGNGIMFISHVGDVQPSGFLPLVAGNVRSQSPVEIYRDAPLFLSLRRAGEFGGRCGRCEFRGICGGSRARAFAAAGDPMAEDPLCPYDPPDSARSLSS